MDVPKLEPAGWCAKAKPQHLPARGCGRMGCRDARSRKPACAGVCTRIGTHCPFGVGCGMAWTWQTAMDAKLSAFEGWHIRAHCAGCRLGVQLDVERLGARHPDMHVAQAVVRLRCSRCREFPAAVALADGHEGDGRAERQRIELLP